MRRSLADLMKILLAAALLVQPGVLNAQRKDSSIVEAKRSMVTRAELQAALDEIQRGLSSSGYSQSIRLAKQAEAASIQERLSPEGGDLRPGDQIMLTVLLEPGLSRPYDVTPDRKIILPGNYEIPVQGVLRSEIQAYLTKKLEHFITDPSVTAIASVRIAIFGGIHKPGFYNVPANELLSNALQTEGGGVENNVKLTKSRILRNGEVVVDGPEFDEAVYKGRTLDQLNIQAGDRIEVALKPASGLFWRVVGAISGLTGILYLVVTLTR